MPTPGNIPNLHRCQPTAVQEQLLRALLADAEHLPEHFRQWDAATTGRDLDLYSLKLLPWLYKKLLSHNVSSPLLDRYRELYAANLHRNLLLRAVFTDIASKFQAEAIPVIALKGLVFSAHYYSDPGARYQQDADLLVPLDQAPLAIKLLRENGWTTSCEITASIFTLRHALNFTNPEGLEVDLHWHLLSDFRRPGDYQSFWDAALPIEIGGVNCLRLCPTDQLFHTIASAIEPAPIPRLNWILDACTLLRRFEHQIDWSRFCQHAARYHLRPIVAAALGYLKNSFAIPIPGGIFIQLASAGFSWREQLLFRHKTCPFPQPLLHLTTLVTLYLAQHPAASPWRTFAGFFPFAKRATNLDSPSAVARKFCKFTRALSPFRRQPGLPANVAPGFTQGAPAADLNPFPTN